MKRFGIVSDDFKRLESHDCPMSTCAAPVGSPCRTGKGRVAIQYHTPRFRLVPQLAKVLGPPTPAVRKPGSVWTELPRPVSAGAEPVGHVRLGDLEDLTRLRGQKGPGRTPLRDRRR
ncbi:zinc finger domain-containing protein [Streptomyces hawaiiensis]